MYEAMECQEMEYAGDYGPAGHGMGKLDVIRDGEALLSWRLGLWIVPWSVRVTACLLL